MIANNRNLVLEKMPESSRKVVELLFDGERHSNEEICDALGVDKPNTIRQQLRRARPALEELGVIVLSEFHGRKCYYRMVIPMPQTLPQKNGRKKRRKGDKR